MGTDTTKFALYSKTRTEVPDTVDDLFGNEGGDLQDVEPDEIIEGFENLTDFLEENTMEREVDVSDVDWRDEETTTIEVGEYFWNEVDAVSAPERTICSECDTTLRTRSDERVEKARQAHHAGTGH